LRAQPNPESAHQPTSTPFHFAVLILHLHFWVATTALLYVINQNHWSLVALPLIYLVSRMHINIPHLRLAFYIYYPLHFAGLMLIKYALLK
jgi:hypothetical protein